MGKKELIEKLGELKKFYDKNPEAFGEITGGVTALFEAIKVSSPEDVAEGVDYVLELQTAEGMLDKEIAVKKAGAKTISAIVDILLKILISKISPA